MNTVESSTINVVIVENERTMAETLQLVINKEKNLHCQQIFFNGEEAVKAIPELKPDVALVDIDLGLHRMTGIEMIAMLKEKCPNTSFMILTIYEDHQKVYDALSAGALGYVLKSASPDKIISSIYDLKEGGSPMSPAIARKITSFFSPGKTSLSPESDLLSGREREVIELISKGKLEKEVAAELFISLKTVKSHISNIYTKLQVRTRVEALNKYFGR
ncbi:MAG: response regulator transcription factor [Bacteroidota bacterium]|nr:response regulator transcription factor [Bacteroidota bacterium]